MDICQKRGTPKSGPFIAPPILSAVKPWGSYKSSPCPTARQVYQHRFEISSEIRWDCVFRNYCECGRPVETIHQKEFPASTIAHLCFIVLASCWVKDNTRMCHLAHSPQQSTGPTASPQQGQMPFQGFLKT